MAAGQAIERSFEEGKLAGINWYRVGWGAALVGVGGDLVTTIYGLQAGLAEQNPFVLGILGEYGIAGLLGLKLVAILWVLIIAKALGRRYGTAAAFGLAIPQLIAVTLNLVTIAQI